METKPRKCIMCGAKFHIFAEDFLVCGMCGTFIGRRRVNKNDDTIEGCPRKSGVSYKSCSTKCKFHKGSLIVNVVKKNGTAERRSGTKTVAVLCGKTR